MKKYAIYVQFKCSSYFMVHVELVDSDIKYSWSNNSPQQDKKTFSKYIQSKL